MPSWRLIEDPPLDGYRNMAADEALLEACSEGAGGFPCLRLYAFAPPALSLGFSQDHARAADLAFCRARGIDVVRRPTGGRAVLHADEVTYAVVAKYGEPPFEGGVLDTYRAISRGLIAGFARLGLAARMAEDALSDGSPRGGAVCFAGPSRHEIVAGGCKVAGSAQARRRGAFLQHGSIPIRIDAALLAGATGAGSAGTAGAGPIRGIAQILSRPISPSDLSLAVREGLESALGVRILPGALAPRERERAERLRADRYLSAAWTFRR